MAYQAFAFSPQEAWYWQPYGGVQLPLQSPYGAWNTASFGGSRFALPAFRGQNYQTPYRAGQSWRAKFPDSRTLTVAMWVDGQGQQLPVAQYPSSDPRLAFNNNLQQLRAALFSMNAAGSTQGQLTRNWYLTQAGTPQLVQAVAAAELAGSMDLTMSSRLNAVFSVDFLLADPWFYGTQQSQAVTTSGASVVHPGDAVAGIGFPSVAASFTVQCSAACTVTNTTAGVSFTLTAGPSYPVVVDVLNGTVTDNGGANQVAALTHQGARAWMALLPGSNWVTVSAGTATFQWTPPYL